MTQNGTASFTERHDAARREMARQAKKQAKYIGIAGRFFIIMTPGDINGPEPALPGK
ncbi:hypothetical protein [Hafnia psychrotolerans]|uniref:Uncharacterized protein n=1 Tax=Hafnia psychrotolerans TaxID=1477018 RepID=A0ABQ1GKI8_9GAMM|nr:hypothetical protein [Hafnia psychrotolerans]GGA45327.1 hypothetical protein GCM10011328_20620 [Hafnia psychrotolerans]